MDILQSSPLGASISTSELEDSSVTNAKISAKTIEKSKLAMETDYFYIDTSHPVIADDFTESKAGDGALAIRDGFIRISATGGAANNISEYLNAGGLFSAVGLTTTTVTYWLRINYTNGDYNDNANYCLAGLVSRATNNQALLVKGGAAEQDDAQIAVQTMDGANTEVTADIAFTKNTWYFVKIIITWGTDVKVYTGATEAAAALVATNAVRLPDATKTDYCFFMSNQRTNADGANAGTIDVKDIRIENA